MLVDVQIPNLVAQLPQASTRQVIALGDNKDVSVVQLDANRIPPGEITPWRLSLHLGSNVSLKRSDVELFVSGSPVIDLDDTAQMSGTIDVAPGGRVPVLGKVFIVEHGRVIFDTGDTANPRLEVSAAWRAPDDTMVYVGRHRYPARVEPCREERPAATGARGLRAAPRRLVSGLEHGDAIPPTENGGLRARARRRSAPAWRRSASISSSPNKPAVELRVDTTSQSLPRYTAAVRVRPNLWFEASEYQQTDYGTGGRVGPERLRRHRRLPLHQPLVLSERPVTGIGRRRRSTSLWQYRY